MYVYDYLLIVPMPHINDTWGLNKEFTYCDEKPSIHNIKCQDAMWKLAHTLKCLCML